MKWIIQESTVIEQLSIVIGKASPKMDIWRYRVVAAIFRGRVSKSARDLLICCRDIRRFALITMTATAVKGVGAVFTVLYHLVTEFERKLFSQLLIESKFTGGSLGSWKEPQPVPLWSKSKKRRVKKCSDPVSAPLPHLLPLGHFAWMLVRDQECKRAFLETDCSLCAEEAHKRIVPFLSRCISHNRPKW
jgi:hypothetical protein